MKAIYTRYELDNENLLGDDLIFVNIYFRTEKDPELIMPYCIPFEHLHRHIGTYNKAVYDYWSSIRASIHGYGPKHSIVLEAMQAEGFELTPHVIKFIESIREEEIQKHINFCASTGDAEKQKEYKQIFESLSVSPEAKSYSMQLSAYKDQLDMNIHETTLNFFPELFEKSTKHIAAYKNILTNTVLNFTEHLDKLMHDQFVPYWEERYEKKKE